MVTILRKRFAVGLIAALGGAVLWGFSGSCAQLMLAGFGVDALFITAVRTVIAAILLMVVAGIRYRSVLAEILQCAKLRARILLFGVGLFLSQSTFALSVEQTNAGTATVLQSLATIFVMVIACCLMRRLPRAFEALGLACALASTWLIATQGNPGELQLPLGGLLWGLANAGAVTLYIMIPKPLYERWSSLPVIACGMTIAALVACLVWAVSAMISNSSTGMLSSTATLDAEGWLVLILGIGILGTACAFGLYLYGVAIVGSVRGSLLGAAEPASAMVITAAWLGTAFTSADWLGLLLMLAMIALVARGGQRE